jgi:hypothetical protein
VWRLAAVCDLRVDYVKANLEADADEILAHDE